MLRSDFRRTGVWFQLKQRWNGGRLAPVFCLSGIQRRYRQPRWRSEPFELEFDELFEDELEFELLDEFDELFEDEFELELLEELELELLEEFDELLPATMMEPSPRLVAVLAGRSTSIAGAVYCLASAAVPATAVIPATSAEANVLYFVMGLLLCSDRVWSGGVTGDDRAYSMPRTKSGPAYFGWPSSRSACASSPASIGACAAIAVR